MAKRELPRGLRNNNPLNIRSTGVSWKGQCGVDQDGFCIFINRPYGYRAAFRILCSYRVLHGITTIKEIVNRWAPPSENNTKSYIQFVCDILNTFETSSFHVGSFDPTEEERSIDLVSAMAVMESGWNIMIKRGEIKQGYKLAFPKEV